MGKRCVDLDLSFEWLEVSLAPSKRSSSDAVEFRRYKFNHKTELENMTPKYGGKCEVASSNECTVEHM